MGYKKKLGKATMRRIADMKDAGKSYAQISKATGVTERHLYNMDHDRARCRLCIYRAKDEGVNNCDYICFTGERRGCGVENCERFVKGPRLRHNFKI